MTPADAEKLVEAYGQACYDEGIAVARRDSQRDREATTRELNARAALLAAMGQGGEVGEVIRVTPCAQIQMYEVIVAVEGVDWPHPGDRVLVRKVEGT